MWFKNLQVLQLTESVGYKPEQLSIELEQAAFKPCGKAIPATAGWVAPIGGEDAPLVYGSNAFMIFCLKSQEKVLPATVVREQLSEQVAGLQNDGRKVSRKEKERMKDELYYSLLSQAFAQSQRTYAYIDPQSGWLIVDTSARKRLEQFMGIFSNSVQSYRVVEPELNSVSALLTRWLKEQMPRGFELADACVMEDLSEKVGTIRVKNKDLGADNVQSFLREGCQVTQLTMSWYEQIQFTLKQDFSFTGVKFLDAVQDLAKDGLTETVEERFAADFVIMAETLRKFLADLARYFVVREEAVPA